MNIEHVNNNEAQYDQRWSDEMSSVLPEKSNSQEKLEKLHAKWNCG